MPSSNEGRTFDLGLPGSDFAHVTATGPTPEGETWRDAGTGAVVAKPKPGICHFCTDSGTTCEQRELTPGSRIIVHAPA